MLSSKNVLLNKIDLKTDIRNITIAVDWDVKQKIKQTHGNCSMITLSGTLHGHHTTLVWTLWPWNNLYSLTS